MTDDNYLLVHDAATVSFDSVESDGITVDEDGEAEFDWSEVPVVRLDEPPHARAFDTDEFYKIEGATTARPIRQPYRVGDDVEVYVKPADELRDAAWSLENRPYVLGHPDTGMVKDVSDVHGFWRNPRYDDDEDRLKEDLYIPRGDEEAKEFVSENEDVSLGFYNRIHRDYEGDIGALVDTDEEHVDGFQVDLYVDHIAGVERGRCSSAHGCGLDDGHDLSAASADSVESEQGSPCDHGTVIMEVDDTTSFLSKEDQTKATQSDPEETGDADSTETESVDNTTMTDPDSTNDGESGFDLPDLSIDALAEKHDDVRALREAKNELESDLDEVREGLDLDEDECPCDTDLDTYAEAKETVEELRDAFDADEVDLVEFAEDMHEEWQEARDEKREELLDELEDLKADREEWEDEDIEDIEEEIDRRSEIAKDFDASGITEDTEPSEDDGTDTFMGKRRYGRGER